MINDFFSKCYCINLDRRTDRWEHCINEFNKHNIIVERFSAVDGNINNYNLGYPFDNELANTKSHLNVIKEAKKLGLKNILIFEDDVVFQDNVNELFDLFIQQLPENWDGIYFGGNHIQGRIGISPNIIKMIRSYALHAYGINGKAYDSIIEYLEKKIELTINDRNTIRESVGSDFFIADLHRTMNFYCFTPHIAYQLEGYSDIQKAVVSYPFLK
jgi:hypothetical protein